MIVLLFLNGSVNKYSDSQKSSLDMLLYLQISDFFLHVSEDSLKCSKITIKCI